MRAPTSDLPLTLSGVRVVRGGVALLDAVSLTIEPGPATVILGPNGAGKSTLLRVAMGLIAPDAGSVTWGGRPNVDTTRRAFVFQRPAMLRRSAAANVVYALAAAGVPRDRRNSRASELLDRVGLGPLAERPARRLSGGEQQRLALARALARDPEILILDEPTANLDPAATKAVESIVAEAAASGVKVVMSTHDLGQARRLAGEIVFMAAGRVLERTPADAFFAGPATLEAAAFLAGDLVLARFNDNGRETR